MKKVINCVLFVCAAAMLFICYRSIADQQDFKAEVAEREAVVKARLIEIRSAEEAYKEQHDEYCSDWDSLIAFVKNGRLPIVIKQGTLSDAQMEKGLTESKAAAIVNSGNQAAIIANGLQDFRRDTTWVSLIDSLYESGFDAEQLRYIPYSEIGSQDGKPEQFELIACPSTTKSGSIIQVMECNAPFTAFLRGDSKLWAREIATRIEDAQAKGAYEGLRIGEASMNWNNNAGNWE